MVAASEPTVYTSVNPFHATSSHFITLENIRKNLIFQSGITERDQRFQMGYRAIKNLIHLQLCHLSIQIGDPA